MDEPPFSLAFVMVKEIFVVPARLFYLASDANKNKRPDHLNPITNPTPLPNPTLTNGATARNPNYRGSRVYPNYRGSRTQP